ncbi:MAG: hypothetical protein CSA13_01570 [Clostridiales bacterium]|nr:MAG: hypothetical protein CSA13_01570 [Clostridiales bacterium]
MELLKDSAQIIGFSEVLKRLKVMTAYGKDEKNAMSPFTADRLAEHRQNDDTIESFVREIVKDRTYFKILRVAFEHLKDLRGSIKNIENQVTLTQVELYELKFFLLQVKRLTDRYQLFFNRLENDLRLTFPLSIYQKLDPTLDYYETFHIDDNFSEALKAVRMKIRALENEMRKMKGQIAKGIVSDYPALRFRPNGTVVVRKEESGNYQALLNDKRLLVSEQHYNFVTFSIVLSDEILACDNQLETLRSQEEDALYDIREKITGALQEDTDRLRQIFATIGKIDFYLAKASLAVAMQAVRPKMTVDGHLIIEEGRHAIVESLLSAKKQTYTPVSIQLDKNVTLITGANMGGKTISLKMVGLIVAMANYGLFVPAKSAVIPYYRFINAIIGDEQNAAKGLSTFGAEMVEIIDALAASDKRGLVLIDELASGTNPAEGWALSDSILEEFCQKRSDVVVTTHYDGLGKAVDIRHLQVIGLKNLPETIDKNQVSKTLAEGMDYRLESVEKDSIVPKDAIKIAAGLGLASEIISRAKCKMEKS